VNRTTLRRLAGGCPRNFTGVFAILTSGRWDGAASYMESMGPVPQWTRPGATPRGDCRKAR
jgi:hypothetical protein